MRGIRQRLAKIGANGIGDNKFATGDTAIFGNPAAASTVTVSGTVAPGAIVVGNTTNNYTFAGTAISGSGSLTKNGAGTLAVSVQETYTGGTTVNGGILDMTGGGGSTGTIRGTVTVNTGGTLRLSTGDATGYNGGASALTVINLNGGTLNVNTTSNQTLGSAVINMTGGSITGVTGGNIDFFGGASALNTLPSATTSTISGVPLTPLRQGNTTFTVAKGTTASGIDLDISSVLKGSSTAAVLTKAGAGTMRLTAVNTLTTNGISVTGGTLVLGFGTVTSNILASTVPLALGGGTLSLTNGSAGAVTQTVSGLTVTASTGSQIILANASETLTLGALTSAGANSALNFNTAAGGADASTSAVGTSIVVLTGQTAGATINPGYTVTDTTGFGLATVNASNQVIRLATGTLLPASGAGSATNYRIDNNNSGADGGSALAVNTT